MYWWRFAVVHYLPQMLGPKVEDVDAFDEMLDRQSKHPGTYTLNASPQNGTFFDMPRAICVALSLPKTVLSA